ncbi:hypothetical protein [Neisseria sp.]|uniref:hypothetical protein n=1 Tax=Neisseria sp. TaxID=192066 RepID=UPI00359F39B4
MTRKHRTKSGRQKQAYQNDILFMRAYLITLGLLFVCLAGLLVWLFMTATGRTDISAVYMTWAVFLVFLLLGAALCGVGLFGSNKAVDWWADTLGGTDIEILAVVVLAVPVYLLLKRFENRKLRK